MVDSTLGSSTLVEYEYEKPNNKGLYISVQVLQVLQGLSTYEKACILIRYNDDRD
jgi:hypothetical protein